MHTPPILLIVYNRPYITKKLLEILGEQKPRDIFVFCDGPKNHSDKSFVAETRVLFDKLPWACNISKNFQKNNLGCQKGVASAITWFFENVTEGIILEDDCIPNKSFFDFTASLLEKYRNDTRISMISGSNQGFKVNKPDSYFYSRYSIVWGWATWADKWESYTNYFKINNEILFSKNNIKACRQFGVSDKFISNIRKSHEGKINSWGYLWSYFNLIENRLSIIPKNNLVKNIGFGKYATHTKIETRMSELKRKDMPKIINHPLFQVSNYRFDSYIIKTHNTLFIAIDFISLKIRGLFK